MKIQLELTEEQAEYLRTVLNMKVEKIEIDNSKENTKETIELKEDCQKDKYDFN